MKSLEPTADHPTPESLGSGMCSQPQIRNMGRVTLWEEEEMENDIKDEDAEVRRLPRSLYM